MNARLRERFIWWLLGLAEYCVFSVVPRGPLRRRLRDRIDWMLTRPRCERREHDRTEILPASIGDPQQIGSEEAGIHRQEEHAANRRPDAVSGLGASGGRH
jgi:hypothetical protein